MAKKSSHSTDYAAYGLDTVKRSQDPGTKGKGFCTWCQQEVGRGFSMCFQHFCICPDCVIGARNKEYRWKPANGDQCFKCSKDHKGKKVYDHLFYDKADSLGICEDCLQWAEEVLFNNQSTTMKSTTDFRTIALEDIHPDPNQPRKIYDETAMQELVASVKEKGVLQPVLIRPNGKGYILVCGERRYRASKEAGLEQIPAVIRTLSDEEAMELQIIENLQRKDVHPMEEAVAFKSLQQKFSVEDIAHRVGKTPAFVALRIGLTNLLPLFQELLFANVLRLKEAIALCRLESKAQQAVLDECRLPKDWQKRKDFQLGSIDWYIRRQEHELNEAPFKTEDPDLYPEMGACNTCQYNSAANKLLFPELQRKRICHNGVCYQIKAKRFYQKGIEKAMQDPELFFISADGYPNGDQKTKIKAAEDMGCVVLMPDAYEVFKKPEPVPSWEEYLKENDDWSDDEDLTDEDRKEREQDCKNDYDLAVDDFEAELAGYNNAVANNAVKKAFVVLGGYRAKEGSIIDIVLKAKKGAKLELNVSAPSSQQQLQVEMEIATIREREDRNKELDREKVYKRLVELFKLAGNDFQTSVAELSPDEWVAVVFALCDNSYAVRNYVDEALKVSDSYEGLKRYKAIRDNQDVTILYKALRLFIHDKLINLNECDYAKRGKPAAMFVVGKQYWPREVKSFELEQKEKAAKREVNVIKRLGVLEDKKKELQAASKSENKPAKKKGAKA